MENTERKQEEMNIQEGTLELCIDHEHITIPVARFEELVKIEEKMGIIMQVHKKTESYKLQEYLSIMFGCLPEKE